MEYILKLNEANQLSIPSDIIKELDLKPGSHFTAKIFGGSLVIEWLPFSSFQQANSVQQTIEELQK